MLFNSSAINSDSWGNSNAALDPRRSADYGWNPNNLEPNIDKSTGKLWTAAPPMLASFDLETTGFDKAEPISFGLAIFRDGKFSDKESQHFLIEPRTSITQGAFETHGWTNSDLKKHRHGIAPDMAEKPAGSKAPALTQEDIGLAPAVPLSIGINKIVGVMANLQKQGFVFIGANPTYDTKIIKGVWERENMGMPVQVTGFNPNSMRLIDVIKHDHSIESKEVNPRSRALAALAAHYGIDAGGHRALHDSIAAGRVFIEGQIPAAQKIAEKLQKRGNISFTLSSKEANGLGIEWTLGGPCLGVGCGFCAHLGEVAMSHTDPGKAGKVNGIMQMHQGM